MYEFAASLLYQLLTICDSWISNADLKESVCVCVCVYMYICVCVYIKIMLPYVYFFLWLNL